MNKLKHNGKDKCFYETTKYNCQYMKEKENYLDMEYERYECKVCGESYKLDYDEMR